MTRMDEAVTREREAEIRARLAQATPGPWVVDRFATLAAAREDGGFRWAVGDCFGSAPVGAVYRQTATGGITGLPGCVETSLANATLIANAPADLADLLAEVDRLRADKERLTDEWLANEWRPLRWLNAPQRAAVLRYAESLVTTAISEGERVAMDAAAPTTEATP